LGILGSEVGDVGELGAGGGVMDGEAAGAGDPLSVDEGVGLEEAGVFEGGERERCSGSWQVQAGQKKKGKVGVWVAPAAGTQKLQCLGL
jgi:hypothetical protein